MIKILKVSVENKEELENYINKMEETGLIFVCCIDTYLNKFKLSYIYELAFRK